MWAKFHTQLFNLKKLGIIILSIHYKIESSALCNLCKIHREGYEEEEQLPTEVLKMRNDGNSKSRNFESR